MKNTLKQWDESDALFKRLAEAITSGNDQKVSLITQEFSVNDSWRAVESKELFISNLCKSLSINIFFEANTKAKCLDHIRQSHEVVLSSLSRNQNKLSSIFDIEPPIVLYKSIKDRIYEYFTGWCVGEKHWTIQFDANTKAEQKWDILSDLGWFAHQTIAYKTWDQDLYAYFTNPENSTYHQKRQAADRMHQYVVKNFNTIPYSALRLMHFYLAKYHFYDLLKDVSTPGILLEWRSAMYSLDHIMRLVLDDNTCPLKGEYTTSADRERKFATRSYLSTTYLAFLRNDTGLTISKDPESKEEKAFYKSTRLTPLVAADIIVCARNPHFYTKETIASKFANYPGMNHDVLTLLFKEIMPPQTERPPREIYLTNCKIALRQELIKANKVFEDTDEQIKFCFEKLEAIAKQQYAITLT